MIETNNTQLTDIQVNSSTQNGDSQVSNNAKFFGVLSLVGASMMVLSLVGAIVYTVVSSFYFYGGFDGINFLAILLWSAISLSLPLPASIMVAGIATTIVAVVFSNKKKEDPGRRLAKIAFRVLIPVGIVFCVFSGPFVILYLICIDGVGCPFV